MHAHRIKILDRANDYNIVMQIPHGLEFELLPSDNRLLDENGMDRTQIETTLDDTFEFLTIKRDAAPCAAQRERRPDHDRKTKDLHNPLCLSNVGDDFASRSRKTDPHHGLFEKKTIFGHLHGIGLRTDHLDVVFVKNTALVEFDGNISGGLTSYRRQQSIRSFAFDD